MRAFLLVCVCARVLSCVRACFASECAFERTCEDHVCAFVCVRACICSFVFLLMTKIYMYTTYKQGRVIIIKGMTTESNNKI